MQDNINKTRAHLGELATLAGKTEAAERKILKSAIERLAVVKGQMQEASAKAMAGGEADKDAYMELVKERGILNQVIAESNRVLAG